MPPTNLCHHKATGKGFIYGAWHKSGDLVGSSNKGRVIKCPGIRDWTPAVKNVWRGAVNRGCRGLLLEKLVDMIKSLFYLCP